MLNRIASLCFFVFTIVCIAPVHAKPMPAPSLTKAIQVSTCAVCKFERYKSGSKVDYFSGVRTRYKVVRLLNKSSNLSTKPLVGKYIWVQHQFDDGSACIAPKPWKFKSSMLPAKGELMILFLTRSNDGLYYTYRGSLGVKPYSKNLQTKILRIGKLDQ